MAGAQLTQDREADCWVLELGEDDDVGRVRRQPRGEGGGAVGAVDGVPVGIQVVGVVLT